MMDVEQGPLRITASHLASCCILKIFFSACFMLPYLKGIKHFLCFFRFEDVGADGSLPLRLWAAAGRQAQRRAETDLQHPGVARPTGQTWSQWASWSTRECGHTWKRWQRWQERGKGRKGRHRYYENQNLT